MTTANDVPAKDLITTLAKKLQTEQHMTPPLWVPFVRTGLATHNPPENPDWWYNRCASIMRKLYIHETIGVNRLKDEYGGKHDKGSKPHKAKSGSGSITRKALQQLEKAGYVNKVRGKGRILTPKGRKLLDNTAYEIQQQLLTQYPSLKKY